jgi:hypothetical protein
MQGFRSLHSDRRPSAGSLMKDGWQLKTPTGSSDVVPTKMPCRGAR